jgi:hypothetical protein
MWILKGTLLGLWLMWVGTLAVFYFTLYRNIPPHSKDGGLWWLGFGTVARVISVPPDRTLPPTTGGGISGVDTRVFTVKTIQNPLWWAALVVCFVLSYAIARPWSGPTILWIGLLVTGPVPAGILALFITAVVKLRHAAQGHP